MTETYKSILNKFISFKSISTDSVFKNEVRKTAEFLKDLFKENKFETEIIEGFSNPIVLASHIVDETKETCLIYGHYDVQPADISEGWDFDPFTVSEKNGRLIARGIVDNKGQTLIHIATIFDLIKENKLAYNIKFMLEGDEETGSPDLPRFVEEYKEKLKCDFYMISDGTLTAEHPSIEASFRGGLNSTLTIKTATTDMHSGMYGGAVPNSAHVLGKFIAELFDENSKVAIPGFYDDVIEVTDFETDNNKSIPFDMKELDRITGVKELVMENEYDYYTNVALRPSIQITGIKSGYTAEGYRNAIAAESSVRVNFRLVANQDPKRIAELYEEFVKSKLPSYAEYKLVCLDLYNGVKLNLKNKFVEKAEKVLNESFGKKVLHVYCGGGLPIVTLFDEQISRNGVLVPLGNEDCNMHAINENFDLNVLEKGLEFSRKFFSK